MLEKHKKGPKLEKQTIYSDKIINDLNNNQEENDSGDENDDHNLSFKYEMFLNNNMSRQVQELNMQSFLADKN